MPLSESAACGSQSHEAAVRPEFCLPSLVPPAPEFFPMPRWSVVAFVLVLAFASPVRAQVDFSREILPILSDNCFLCHGPDAKNRKAKLRLDDEKSAKAERDTGAAIVPG